MSSPMRVNEARAAVAGAVNALPAESVPVAEAAGRWLAEPLIARVAHPPMTCSAMDGYAVHAAEAPRTEKDALRVTRVVYAGDPAGSPLRPGEAVRIFTGAPLPPGADAVVREEVARREGDHVSFTQPVTAGDNVRKEGEDVPKGSAALPAGVRLGARQLGLCHAVGADKVQVTRRPRVTVISTGDEIARGLVPDSNGVSVVELLRAIGAEVTHEREGDDPARLGAAVAEALEAGDLAITIGGVSVGEKDHVPVALQRLGAHTLVHGIQLKPGKPFLFATVHDRPVFGLPGSPSACLVSFEIFVRPAVLALCGAARRERRTLTLPLAEDVPGRPGRMRALWSRLEADGTVRPLGKDTAQVRGPALADALIFIPETASGVAAGIPVETWLLEDPA